jgi:hypothetical protein
MVASWVSRVSARDSKIREAYVSIFYFAISSSTIMSMPMNTFSGEGCG